MSQRKLTKSRIKAMYWLALSAMTPLLAVSLLMEWRALGMALSGPLAVLAFIGLAQGMLSLFKLADKVDRWWERLP